MKGRKVEIEEVLNWHSDNLKGMSIKNISTKYKRDYKTIKYWFNKYKISYISRPYKNCNLMHQLYLEYKNSNKSILQLAKENNIHPKVIITGWDYFNLDYKIDLTRGKGKSPNHSFFSNINSEIKAYLLGFFSGDGHIEKRKDYNSYTLRVSVHKKDKYILDLFNQYIGNNEYNIFKSSNNPNILNVTITSKQLGEDLFNLGYNNRKTYTSYKLPDIPKEYMRHFIRGYFDADGCISKYTISFSSYNKSTLLHLLLYLPRVTRYKLNYRTATKIVGRACYASCWTLEICKKDYLPFIYNYFYKDANYFFKRKQKKFLINTNCSVIE